MDERAGVAMRGSRFDPAFYNVLDEPGVQQRFTEYASERTVMLRFEVPGMHCASCVWLLDQLHRFDAGVLRSDVDFMRKTVRVEIDRERTTASAVAKLLSSLGYEPLINTEGNELGLDVQRRSVIRGFYMRIGIAGFAAGNVMMISIARYLAGFGGLTATLETLFSVLSIGLSIPVLVYSASPWYRSAIGALRHKRMNLDVPVALGISVLFIRSVFDIVSGTGEGFLDSFAGLVVFLLVGRLFQQKAFDAVSFDRTYRSFFPLSVRVERKGQAEIVPIDQVKIGDVMLIRNGEVVPCDSVLISPVSYFDYAFVTGESLPVENTEGQIVHAGGKVVGSAARLTATKNVSQSYLASLWERAGGRRARRAYLDLSDRFGARFTYGAIAIALAGFVFWLPDLPMAVNVLTAVLIIACPCALTIAAPVTLGTAMARLGMRGIYVKEPGTLLELTDPDVVIFDKTGTLTEPEHRLTVDPRTSAHPLWPKVQALASQSTHPISRSIASDVVASDMEHVTEVPGKGIVGTVDGYHVVIGSIDLVREYAHNGDVASDSTAAAYALVDGEVIGILRVEPRLRKGIADVITALRRSVSLRLVTGDTDRDRPLFERLFRRDEMVFNQGPDDKVDALNNARSGKGRVVMIGDGLNDAAAMSAADASIAITDGTSTLVPACDVVMSAKEVENLPKLFWYAKTMTKVIRANLIFTVFYNVLGLSLALSGILTPVLTAILMPVSSLIVIGMSVGGAHWYARRMVWG
jgi:Cu+-exporting ATPase